MNRAISEKAPCCCICYGCRNGDIPPRVLTLYAHISDHTNCGCLDGLTVELNWDSSYPMTGLWEHARWWGRAAIGCPFNGHNSHISLALSCCFGQSFRLWTDFCLNGDTGSYPDPCNGIPPDAGWSCDPYCLVWPEFGIQGCCNAGVAPPDERVRIVINETP